MTTTAPTLLEGFWYHDQAQGTKVHLLRTVEGMSDVVRTLCGQVWLKASAERLPDQPEQFLLPHGTEMRWSTGGNCQRCLKAESRWRAK